ncbi:MAG TPA: L,D-transpeptidase [Rhizomicrobium sp.]|jgi:hypothetical protein
MVYKPLTGLLKFMTAAKNFGTYYLAAASILALGLAISYRSAQTPEPRLEFSWQPVSEATAPSRNEISTRKISPAVISQAAPRGAPVTSHGQQLGPITPDRTEVARVEERLKDNLTQELYDDFKLFLYVSKASSGPWAQQMYVFRKASDGDLEFMHDWPVSTGRERVEHSASGQVMTTHTPPGYYELDPRRFYVHHTSSEWHQPMPYAMFFNWIRNGNATGLAIHSATGNDIAKLGHRASAGCIHLSPQAAHALFDLIRSQYRGAVPRFAIDDNGTMNNDGIVLRDADGRPQFAKGYKVLVFIENYGGRNVIAAIY